MIWKITVYKTWIKYFIMFEWKNISINYLEKYNLHNIKFWTPFYDLNDLQCLAFLWVHYFSFFFLPFFGWFVDFSYSWRSIWRIPKNLIFEELSFTIFYITTWRGMRNFRNVYQKLSPVKIIKPQLYPRKKIPTQKNWCDLNHKQKIWS